jgi:hypothetical protein
VTGLTFNTEISGACNCVDPYQVVIEVRRPSFSSITDALMEELRVDLYTDLGLQNQQVMVEKAMFTPDGRAEINVNFFAADGASPPSQDLTLNITHSLNTQLLELSAFNPYILKSVEPTNFASGKSLLTFYAYWIFELFPLSSNHSFQGPLHDLGPDLVVGTVGLLKGTSTRLEQGLLLASYWAFSLY